jgi:hypothetical protein
MDWRFLARAAASINPLLGSELEPGKAMRLCWHDRIVESLRGLCAGVCDFRQSCPGKSPAVGERSCRVFFLLAFSLDPI